ncbi:DMT family transporter [Endozoicomonas sp. 8E]|uniref:DMT family transporter n=1 Tax=Endozoicomonas sp. 8E TaxID=3035692 RepID=UPI00293906AC|nr:EamA family transporter [Endozoicomonas sp. 8E]WOG29022.1 EamA family transporter [Endozoicomonas sp. 8E]
MSRSLQADAVMLLVTLLAASGWIFTKLALEGLPPIAFLALRFLGSFLLLVIFCWYSLFRLNLKQWRCAVSVGLVQGITMMIWILAINRAGQVSEGAFITSMLSIIAPIIAWLFFSSHLKRETLLALPLSLAGMALLALDGSWQFESAQLLFLVSAFGFALHINLTNYFGQNIPSLPFTTIQMAVVGGLAALVSFFTESWPATVNSSAWGWLLASIFLATGFRYTLQTWGIKNSTAGNAALIMTLEPVWTAIMSLHWLGESMDKKALTGCTLILLSLIVSRWQLLKRQARRTGESVRV